MDMEELAALDDGMLIHCFSFLTLQQRQEPPQRGEGWGGWVASRR